MNKIIFSLLSLFCFCSTAAYAETQQHPIDIKYQQCMDTSGGVTLKMMNCIGEADKSWDQRLNTSYNQLKSKLSPEGQKSLLDTQRKWLAYRNSEKNLNTQMLIAVDGGTLHRVIFAEKSMELVRQRTLDFEFYLSNLEYIE